MQKQDKDITHNKEAEGQKHHMSFSCKSDWVFFGTGTYFYFYLVEYLKTIKGQHLKIYINSQYFVSQYLILIKMKKK